MSNAKPMEPNRRALNYFRSTGGWWTPRQSRRRKHKLGHLAALERRDGHVELAGHAERTAP